ncbi:uncharacterized protein LOC134437309 [Engraulis encrasicolus]|uniref:uncharacterized protein LOC134437309 n=1 Tax=Engraulis encrasicolus TaxID=184585 RepID=UPI002FD75CC5
MPLGQVFLLIAPDAFTSPPTARVVVVSPQTPFCPGDEVTLRCDIEEYTDWDSYDWYRNNKIISNKRAQTITITLPQESAPPTAKVRVLSPQPPFYPGDVVTLGCDITQCGDLKHHYKYTWYKDNKTHSKTDIGAILVAKDAGRYQCLGWSDTQTSPRSLPFDIVYFGFPVATVVVLAPLSPGDGITLRCAIADYSDWHQYVWYKYAIQVPDEVRETISVQLPEGSGQYRCYGQRNNRPRSSSMSKPTTITYTTTTDLQSGHSSLVLVSVIIGLVIVFVAIATLFLVYHCKKIRSLTEQIARSGQQQGSTNPTSDQDQTEPAGRDETQSEYMPLQGGETSSLLEQIHCSGTLRPQSSLYHLCSLSNNQ